MPLDTTVGGATTDSYVTRAEFIAYVAARPNNAIGAVADDDTTDNLLRYATKWLDKLCFLGAAASSTQARKFPRTGLLTANGFDLPSNIHPQEIKDAEMELGYLLKQGDLTVASVEPLKGLESMKIGPVQFDFKSVDLKVFQVVPDSVKLVLPQDWLCEQERLSPDTSVEPVLEVL